MGQIFDFGKKVSENLAKYVCIAYFAMEKYVNTYLMPCINKMKVHCWVGAFALLLIGWILAKIF